MLLSILPAATVPPNAALTSALVASLHGDEGAAADTALAPTVAATVTVRKMRTNTMAEIYRRNQILSRS
jgi:hypothetical protein